MLYVQFSSIIALAAACALPLGLHAQGTTTPSSPSPSVSTPPGSMAPGTPLSDPLTGKSFSSVDTNGDGFISREEAAKAQGFVGRFEGLDKDGDGKLSQTEINAVGAPAAGGPGSTSGVSPGGVQSVPGSAAGAPAETTIPGSRAQAPTMTPGSSMGTPGTSPAR